MILYCDTCKKPLDTEINSISGCSKCEKSFCESVTYDCFSKHTQLGCIGSNRTLLNPHKAKDAEHYEMGQ